MFYEQKAIKILTEPHGIRSNLQFHSATARRDGTVVGDLSTRSTTTLPAGPGKAGELRPLAGVP